MNKDRLFWAEFILLNVIVVAERQQCFQGSYLQNGTCVPCPPGTYRMPWHRSPVDQCTPCREFLFNPYYGAGHENLCGACPPDTYSEEGASACKPCPPRPALKCRPGTIPAIPWGCESNCEKCVPGTYRGDNNSTSCTPCPRGLVSRAGAKSILECYPCKAGRHAYVSSILGPEATCKNCPPGYFKPNVSREECEQCPEGFIAPKTGSLYCTPCPRGTRAERYGETCVPCQKGFTTFSEGQTVCRQIGAGCPPDSVKAPSGDCVSCIPNFYVTEDFICKECPDGARSPGGGSRECIACGGTQQATYEGTFCSCADGEYYSAAGVCSKCPPGTFINSWMGGGRRFSCFPCETGMFASNAGSAFCKSCPEGLVSSADRSKCVKCDPGLATLPYLNPNGYRQSICLNVTTGCPPGDKRVSYGMHCQSVLCNVNLTAEEVGKTCLHCPKGSALLGDGTKCRSCPKGYVSGGGMATECDKCPNGLLADIWDGQICSCRAQGYGIQNGTCLACPKGYMSTNEDDECRPCAAGMFSLRAMSGECTWCPPNTFKRKPGAGSCLPCPQGYIGNTDGGATSCISITAFAGQE